MTDKLDQMRKELFIEIADILQTMPEDVKAVYEQLQEFGLIDYDIEKDVLLGDEEDD